MAKPKTPPKVDPTKTTPDLRLTIDGKPLEIFFNEYTGLESRAFRQTMGFSILDVLGTLSRRELPDLDVLACMVWLVRRRTEPDLTYEEVADGMTYQDMADTVAASRERQAEEASQGADPS
jgi:hypothetical protein